MILLSILLCGECSLKLNCYGFWAVVIGVIECAVWYREFCMLCMQEKGKNCFGVLLRILANVFGLVIVGLVVCSSIINGAWYTYLLIINNIVICYYCYYYFHENEDS